jgi:hypothetical protein
MPITPGREPRPCGFCGESSWAGRGDLAGNFLCEPCVKKAEALIAAEQQAHTRKLKRSWQKNDLQ